MSETKKILALPGDGIGQEIMTQALRIIDWMNDNELTDFEITHGFIGGASIDELGKPLTKETMSKAFEADAVLLGAVGGPKWDNEPFSNKPERGLLGIRSNMGLFANLRPAIVFDELVEASSLKREFIEGLDIMIVRELLGGIYFGDPRGIEPYEETSRKGINTLSYTSHEVHRISKLAFELAQKRSKRICSVDKANVLESTLLWREVVTSVGEEFKDVALSHMYVDNAAMQLVRNPKQFDVIVTTNMFGDILSDCAAMLTGSLGMLPSASLSMPDDNGNRRALYEPVHGSAPDIAGQDKANPCAMILSLAMMMRHSFDREDIATRIEKAVRAALARGLRTADIMQEGKTLVGCAEMGHAILEEIAAQKTAT